MDEKKHARNLKTCKRLMTELDIRRGLREKLFYVYPGLFARLHAILDEAEELDWLVQMHAGYKMMGSGNRLPDGSQIIHLHDEEAFNAQVILQEIHDDYWAACLCFQSGFTKQTAAILRSTIELLVQLLCLRALVTTGSLLDDPWVKGGRGLERFNGNMQLIKRSKVIKDQRLLTRLARLYGQLCESTHSRKDRLGALKMPRGMWAKNMPSFEPSEVLYTRGLFCTVLDAELNIIREYLDTEPESLMINGLRRISVSMLQRLAPFRGAIELFEKGYIIHREHAVLQSGRQVLYSVDLDARLRLPGRQKGRGLNWIELHELQEQIHRRLMTDTDSYSEDSAGEEAANPANRADGNRKQRGSRRIWTPPSRGQGER